MALDNILVLEAAEGPAIGYCVPEVGLTVQYGGVSTTIDTVGAASLTLANGMIVGPGQHPGAWPKVLRTNLNSVRGPNWPDGTGDIEFQGADNSGSQTLSKITYLDGSGTPQTSS